MPIKIEPGQDALGVIDVQPTFMPGGALPTPDGEAVVAPINRLLWEPFAFRFATQDWHPPGNITFASRHAGRKPFEQVETNDGPSTLWPDHALQGTPEADLHPDLKSGLFDVIVRKGAGHDSPGYSAFSDRGRRVKTGVASMLRDRGVRRVFLTGLAMDVCVAASAADAALEGFATFIVEDACRASKPRDLPELKSRLGRLGIQFIRSRDLTHPGSGLEI